MRSAVLFFIFIVRDGERESERGIYSHGGEEIVRVERRRGWLMVNGCACYFFWTTSRSSLMCTRKRYSAAIGLIGSVLRALFFVFCSFVYTHYLLPLTHSQSGTVKSKNMQK